MSKGKNFPQGIPKVSIQGPNDSDFIDINELRKTKPNWWKRVFRPSITFSLYLTLLTNLDYVNKDLVCESISLSQNFSSVSIGQLNKSYESFTSIPNKLLRDKYWGIMITYGLKEKEQFYKSLVKIYQFAMFPNIQITLGEYQEVLRHFKILVSEGKNFINDKGEEEVGNEVVSVITDYFAMITIKAESYAKSLPPELNCGVNFIKFNNDLTNLLTKLN